MRVIVSDISTLSHFAPAASNFERVRYRTVRRAHLL
jgi:hypothetical protein